MKKIVSIGLLGPTLDAGKGKRRWDRWRPTVAACQQDDLIIHRFELLYQPAFADLAAWVMKDIQQISPETTVNLVLIDLENPWDIEETYGVLHDFANAYTFKPEQEDYLIHITTGTHVAQICLFLLTEAHYFPAKLLQTSPPNKGGSLPGRYSLIDLDLSKYDQIAQRFEVEQAAGTQFLKAGIDTHNAAFNQLIDEIEYVAMHSTAPILLTGPTGAGKTHLARRVYELKKSRRQIDGPFVEVNCATLQGEGAMSTLFGHTKGAFTGASKDRAGLLRRAHHGMLFLDEVGELGADEQTMLLRAIEEKRFFPLGSDEERTSDFQLLTGTNRDLYHAVEQGQFREDLFARINLWHFRLPSLKERREDIVPNLHYELNRFGQDNHHRITFNKEAEAAYVRFALSTDAVWSANFRDLSASVTRMGTFASSGRISTELVKHEIARLNAHWQGSAQQTQTTRYLATFFTATALAELDYIEQIQLEAVLATCMRSKNVSEASRSLFNVSRTHKKSTNDADRLRKYLAKYNITWQQIREQK